MVVHGDCQSAFGGHLTDHILIEVFNDIARGRNFVEKLLGSWASTLLLIQNGLAEFDALTTDVYVAWSFYERTYIAIAFSAERTKCVLLGGTTAAGTAVSAASHDILT